MTRWIALAVLCLWPASLVAQSVPVRSGEHGRFTRLVLTIPPGTEWNLASDHSARKLALTFGSDKLVFDTSSVFERIGTERIAGLAPAKDGHGLEISLACHCDAEAFVLQRNMLVIDVAPSDRPLEPAEVTRLPDGAKQDIAPPSQLVGDFTDVRIGAFPGLGPEPVRDPSLPLLSGQIDAEDPAGAIAARPDPGSMQAAALGGQIAADLAIAATVGLLDPAVRPVPVSAPDRDPQETTEPPREDDQPEDGSLARQLAAGLSSLDHQTLQDGHISIGSDSCLPGQMLSLSEWVDADASPSKVLAHRRGAVFGEFDRIDESAVEDYARALVHFGFGAEARAVLALGSDAPDTTLRALTYLVEGGADPDHVFAGQSECDSAAALWSALSAQQRSDISLLNEPALLRSFEALPKHLRSFLGPVLAEQLSAYGYPNAAREVLRRLQRMEGRETDEIALGKAQLALKDGDLDEASRRLHDLSVNGGPEAALAVAASVDLADASDTRVPQRIVELSEAFATELRNSDDGRKLWEAHVRSQLVNGDFDAAFADLGTAEGIPEVLVKATQQTALKALVERADDVTFLRHSTRSIREGVLPENETLVVQSARRLTGLGLPEVSLDLLASFAEPGNPSDMRIARAEALLSLGRPEEAEIILIGQRGDAVSLLRAEARKQMGDHAFSKGLYSRLGDREEALNAAWLSGDWADIAQTESAFAPAADLMTREDTVPDPRTEGLGAVDLLSEASAETRETLRALLDATAIPED
ncbi:hypothetical protein [Maliponia aquimaris]|uniref:Tetratricopeptide repeat protein n=1 Tax=Maliponia aquimaris TaxID=1673631 RepID=A0A238JNL0_9RHOB|nr:hypothetical protein [Maliponia aquimaris]SMX32260.1 hypothetical protein MAA8898_00198 [Maliponia aquimaris]